MAVLYIALGAAVILVVILLFPFGGSRNEVQELDEPDEARTEDDEEDATDDPEEVIDKLILRPQDESFAVDEIRSQLVGELGAIEESEGSDVFFLLAEGASTDGLEQFRSMHPEQLPYVGIVDLGADTIVLHQNTGDGGRAQCAAFLGWLARRGCRVFDELGREVSVDDAGKATVATSEATLASGEVPPEDGDAELPDLSHLTADAASSKQVRLHHPSQLAIVYDFDDGTVVVLRPGGTRHQPRPVYQVGVKRDSSREYSGPEDIAFLVDDEANPVPKHLGDAKASPYAPESFQDLVYKRLIVEAGTRATAETRDP